MSAHTTNFLSRLLMAYRPLALRGALVEGLPLRSADAPAPAAEPVPGPAAAPITAAASDPCAVIELRQYQLRPSMRGALVELFEREFVESQEALGMTLAGQFRDLDDADRFVWMRGFPDMTTRTRALTDFYDGPVWAAHREAANATMLDSDDVLLLRRLDDDGDWLPPREPASSGAPPPAGLVTATICPVAAGSERAAAGWFARHLQPLLQRHGAAVFARFVSETAANGFPRLPVREGEHVFVWLAAHAGVAAHARHLDALATLPEWRRMQSAWIDRLAAPPRVLRLGPTPRSRLRGLAAPTSTASLDEGVPA